LSPIVASPCRVLLQLEYINLTLLHRRRDVLLGKKVPLVAAAVVTLIKRLALRCIWSRSGSYRPLISGKMSHTNINTFSSFIPNQDRKQIYTARPDCVWAPLLMLSLLLLQQRGYTSFLLFPASLFFNLIFGCLPYLYLCHRVKEVLNFYSL
jgi:hypothetical protein